MELTRRNALRGLGTVGSAGLGLVFATDGADAASSEPKRRYLVFTDGASKRRLSDLDVIHRLDRIGVWVVRAARSEIRSVPAVTDRTLGHPTPYRPERAPDPAELVDRMDVSPRAVSGDPLTVLQWDKRSQQVFRAWDETRGEGTRVSVIDDGVYPHPDLDGPLNPELSRNFTEDDGGFEPMPGATHGTHVAGILAAEENGTGVVGTAPNVDLVACRVFGEEMSAGGFLGDLLAAMLYSIQVDADVVNMSLGFLVERDTPLARVLEGLFEVVALLGLREGTLFVSAAGNDSINLDESPLLSLPDGVPSIMSISATGPVGYLWDDPAAPGPNFDPLDHLQKPPYEPAIYTNCGENTLSVSAPGGNTLPEILSRPAEERPANWFLDFVPNTLVSWDGADPTPGYGWLAGTSMACPQVAGAAALVHSRNPEAPPSLIRRHIERTADEKEPATCHGSGHLNTCDAVLEPVEPGGSASDARGVELAVEAGPLTLTASLE